MKQIAKKRNTKIILIIALAAILFVAVIILALEKSRTTDFVKNPFYRPSASEIEQQRIDTANKADDSLPTKKDMTDANEGVDALKNTSQVPIAESFLVSIGSFSQDSGSINVTASVENQESADGTCTFTFTKENMKPVVRTTTASDAMCNSNIPEQEFTSTGEWKLEARYFSEEKQAIDTKEVIIR